MVIEGDDQLDITRTDAEQLIAAGLAYRCYECHDQGDAFSILHLDISSRSSVDDAQGEAWDKVYEELGIDG